MDITKGKLKSAYVDLAPFDEAKEALGHESYDLISLEQMAQLRMQEGKNSFIFKEGNFTREGFLYVPKKGIFLTKNSPIMENAKEATKYSRNLTDFYLTDEQVEKALADSCEVPVKEEFGIPRYLTPVLRLSEEKLTAYAFGIQAKAYGEFLKESGIEDLIVGTEIYLPTKPFATQAWSSGGSSILNAQGINSGILLYSGFRVRGVGEK